MALVLGIVIAVALGAILLVPYLVKEIRDGKAELGPLRRMMKGRITLGPVTPPGAGDNNPGRRGDPAPGQSDARGDPYGPRAQRDAPRIKS